MHPTNLTYAKTYNYTPRDGEPIKLKYWYEQLNYWSFTTVTEPETIVLLHTQQIINDLTEI